MKLVKLLLTPPVAAISAAFLTVNAAETTTTWQGPDGGDLADAANWTGNPPQYDAETNPDTKLYFKTSPADSYGVTLLQNLTAYSAKFVSGVGLDVDLNGKTLQFVSDVEFDALSSHTYKDLWPGSDIVFHNGELNLLSADGTTRKQFNFMSDIASGRIGRNSSVTLDGVTGQGSFYSTATNTVVVLTNGTKWVGNYSTHDGAKWSRFVLTGEGTVCDFDNTTVAVNGRANEYAASNEFVVTDHAIATNVANITALGRAGRIEISNGAQLYLPSTLNFSTAGYGRGADFHLTSGNRVTVRTAHFNSSGSKGLTEIAGQGTVLETLEQFASGQGWGFQFACGNSISDARLWIHDGAVVTNRKGTVNIGTGTSPTRLKVELTDNAFLYTGEAFEVLSNTGKLMDFRVDTGAKIQCKRFRFGSETVMTQTNKLWIGHNSSIKASDWVKLGGGAGSVMVISNGTLSVGNQLNVYSGYKVVLAGAAPQISAVTFMMTAADTTVVFDVPETGYQENWPLMRCGATGQYMRLNTNITPVFQMRDFARKTGGKILLAEAAYQIQMDDLEKWQAAATAGCEDFGKAKVYLSADKKKLWLEVKRRYGLAIIVR